ncbi:unnamed protein product (macronuclear) [Paramecium tetraurelia]|uniref:Uncharacterized protein n=1 Tax=Paramecium tetraurelia TaxID=5888 RepID=A0E2T7_PARTE|nr:uncharacterized protein GSPATT00022776001 [Paramecium tetraurelia]CAK89604.1 unnamed protein product [Paramecium tetraurelia]|eukprot:XP_001457001.1 hypothetical protein (macronuclear) [Paramecium tetraurelia strain d4-2]
MLNPEANPLYRQVLYDGEQKTYIRTLQNHKNQKAHTEQYQWYDKQDCLKNTDKITTINNLSTLSNVSYQRFKKPEDNKIFTPLELSKQTDIKVREPCFLRHHPRVTESSAKIIGRFILNEGSGHYNLPPLQPPSETYRNRSQVFFG